MCAIAWSRTSAGEEVTPTRSSMILATVPVPQLDLAETNAA
jgi:hypothetical protein